MVVGRGHLLWTYGLQTYQPYIVLIEDHGEAGGQIFEG